MPRLSRTYATHTELPNAQASSESIVSIAHDASSQNLTKPGVTASKASPFQPNVLTTLYEWPSIRPLKFTSYRYEHLNLPLRRDILHRAVIYEADAARQGTASTKHRTQVRGSGRKIRPQKGTGRARLSDRKSPMLRGGGVAHGPHPRDFSTDLPRKIYDLAWRTALSYRYKKGELIVIDGDMMMARKQTARWFNNFFEAHNWGKGNGRSMVIIGVSRRKHLLREKKAKLLEAVQEVGEHAEVRFTENLTVKDLLSCGRIIIENSALQTVLRQASKVASK